MDVATPDTPVKMIQSCCHHRGGGKDELNFLRDIEDMPDIGTESVNDALIVPSMDDSFSLFIRGQCLTGVA